jgi:hypothetical protein
MAGSKQRGAQGGAATAVRELIASVREGEPLRSGALTFIPLLPAEGHASRPTGYLPLEEALERDLVAITEQAQASVPELLAVSQADAPVVLVGGEQVVGGLQNRVLNTTILLAPHVNLRIPVTCVESGRWSDAPDSYEVEETEEAPAAGAPRSRKVRAFTSDETAYASLRMKHYRAVSGTLASGGGHRSDQGVVWSEVAERMEATGSYSPSSAMHALYKTPERAHKLRETVAALKRPDGALGFVATLNGRTLGAELFADEALAAAYWEKLARSYAVEALDADAVAPEATASAGESRLLEDALAAEIQVHPSPGLGEDARLSGAHVTGAGLAVDGLAIHLSLFPDEQAAEGPRRIMSNRGEMR